MPIIHRFRWRQAPTKGPEKISPRDLPGTGPQSVFEDSPQAPARLDPVPQAVLRATSQKAEQRSANALEALRKKAEHLGYTWADVEKVLSYLRNDAPITINFSPDKVRAWGQPDALYGTALGTGRVIDSFLAGEYYANDFELGTPRSSSGEHPGGQRDGWENVIFEGAYHRGRFNASDRPKYGALNATKHFAGGAQQYGNSFFILKSHVRPRVTVTPFDSSGAQPHHVGTLEHCAHVLLEARNFQGVMDVGLGRKQTDESLDWLYIEVQIHGPVKFSQDIEKCVCATHMRGTDVEVSLRRFCEKNDISLMWTDEPHLWRTA